jgi:hypothetical protein
MGAFNTNFETVNLHHLTVLPAGVSPAPARARTMPCMAPAALLRMAVDTEFSPATSTTDQELTLVHFSAQSKRFLWDRGCIYELSQGFRGCLRCVLCIKWLRLS